MQMSVKVNIDNPHANIKNNNEEIGTPIAYLIWKRVAVGSCDGGYMFFMIVDNI